MAADGTLQQLTRTQIVRLARAVAADNMESIAEGYLDISDETVKNIRRDASNAEAFNRDVIRHWANKHPENQAQKLTVLLFKAADECSLVDPNKIENILGVSRREAHLSTLPAGQFMYKIESILGISRREAYLSILTPVTSKELSTIARNLQPYMDQAMKIEVAPWIRDYVTSMEELYCELVLEKIDNKPYGREYKTLARYQLMFQGRLVSCKKILIKGNPGIGKTTLVKKIAWDWAKGQFTNVSIVFFLYLKSVKPDDAIENAIIEQMPELEGLHVTPGKLESFIEHFGNRTLLILDGLDEHALGKNKDVVKIIKHQKYLMCNILLTSRPHSTREVERHFDTIVRVKGFTCNEARKFASCIVLDDNKVEQILDFNPAGTKKDIVLSECPILLSFMCILVRENELDLSGKTMPQGEIYMRMMQCLYKKFCNRTSIKFEHEKFFKVIASIGKLALETLVSGDPLFQRSRVVEEVGEEVFDYGLLIGNEDMINHLVADILITFLHRSIQEFLGAFYFVLILSTGVSVNSLPRQKGVELVLMQNPLYLHFCFWLLSDKCQKDYFPCADRAKACETLYIYIFEWIRSKQLNFRTHPAIDLNDELCKEHLGKILEMFNGITFLTLSDGQIKWILNHLKHSYHTLKVIAVEDDRLVPENALLPHFARNKDSGSELNIVLFIKVSKSHLLMESCLESRIFSLRQPAVHFTFTDDANIDMSSLFHKDLRKLSLTCNKSTTIDLKGSLESCSFLTHLSIVGYKATVKIKTAVLSALSCVVREGKLPSLTHLQFANVSGLNNGLKYLFDGRFTWSTLTHLCFYNCDLSTEDILTVAPQNSLQKATSLSLSHEMVSGFFGSGRNMFSHEWANLTSLSVQKLNRDGYMTLMNAISQCLLKTLVQLRLSMISHGSHFITELKPEKIPRIKYLGLQGCVGSISNLNLLAGMSNKWELRTLDISHSSDITGNLSHLLRGNFQFLKTLILSDCGLDSKDLSALAEAKVEGQLEKLIHLDVSKNPFRDVGTLFDHSCKWDGLRKFNMAEIGGYLQVGCLEPFMQRDCLLSMSELRFATGDYFRTARSFLQTDRCWGQTQRLEIVSKSSDYVYVFLHLLDAVEKKLFPNLETVCVVCDTEGQIEEMSKELQQLRRAGVIVHFIDSDSEQLSAEIGLI